MAFVELHARSAFSFLRASSTPEELLGGLLRHRLGLLMGHLNRGRHQQPHLRRVDRHKERGKVPTQGREGQLRQQ